MFLFTPTRKIIESKEEQLYHAHTPYRYCTSREKVSRSGMKAGVRITPDPALISRSGLGAVEGGGLHSKIYLDSEGIPNFMDHALGSVRAEAEALKRKDSAVALKTRVLIPESCSQLKALKWHRSVPRS
jgi:hypothetical protein